MKGACPKVPQQMNFSDCGLFTLQFAQSFFRTPPASFKLPIRTLIDWFDQEVVGCKRESIARLIQSLMDTHRPGHGVTLPQIHFNSLKDKMPLASTPPASSPEGGGGQPPPPPPAETEALPPSEGLKRKALDEDELKYEDLLSSCKTYSAKKININLVNRGGASVGLKAPSGMAPPKAPPEEAGREKGKDDQLKIVFEESLHREASLAGSEGGPTGGPPGGAARQREEEDIIGKSPGRIEIRDEDTSEVLLIFNPPDASAEETSHVTEINIDSPPILSLLLSLPLLPHSSFLLLSTSNSTQPMLPVLFPLSSSPSTSLPFPHLGPPTPSQTYAFHPCPILHLPSYTPTPPHHLPVRWLRAPSSPEHPSPSPLQRRPAVLPFHTASADVQPGFLFLFRPAVRD
ncbi:UNVERIFIED_CONTAM: hypothetical protein GTU68_050681 [Idotea baltica]|nr:hypothetical protein [Idotea baltica]